MALKRKISKQVYEKLPEALKAEYSESDGEFVLDIDGDEDTGALKRAKDRETQLRKEAEKKARELEEQLASVSDVDARKKGDIETLEKSWKKKHEETEAQYKARIEKLTNYTTKTLIDGAAGQMASKISTVPTLMARAIRERLSVDLDGDEPTLRVLDTAGKPSALTIDELAQEFIANKDFSSIIVGSKATGGGASKDGLAKRKGSAAQNDDRDDKPTSLAMMNPRDLAGIITAWREANKE